MYSSSRISQPAASNPQATVIGIVQRNAARTQTPPLDNVRNDLNFTWNIPRIAPAPFNLPLAVISGLLMGFMHIPFGASFLVVIPLSGLLFASAREATPRLAARAAFFGWLAFWAVHLFWLPQSFAPNFGIAVWFLMPFVWVIEAGFNAALTWVVYRATGRPLPFLGAMAGALVLLEWMRGLGPLAFPWGNFGYTLIGTPLAQVASLGGVYLGSLIVLMCASSIAAVFFYEWRWLPVAGMIIIASLIYGLTRPAPPIPTRQAWLMQGNIDPFKNFIGETRSLEIFTGLLKGAPKDAVVVLPEAALNIAVVASLEPPLPPALRLPSVPKLLAGVSDSRQGARLNAVASVTNSRLLATTNKTFLVPFGEYQPLRREASAVYDFVFRIFNLPNLQSADPGNQQRILELGGERFGAFVCYDSIFPSLPRSLVLRGAQVLVEPTNDGWFGGGAGNYQHFAMDKMRAIETGRYLLRVANTGITASIDPNGRVLEELPLNVSRALLARYAPLETITPYVLLGDWALWLAAVIVIAAMLLARSRTNW